ncbi:Isopenicillin N synthase-like [Trema orientale]|uniref:Isopenicillin N synthase-like n=1 Tax=Trema orientale TaxID=63057 RepID=A0A2P5FZ26_TREOI|nr:Isopenicillin N synthase-like [Trema orientale]
MGREACEEYGREVEILAFKLMELIALESGLASREDGGAVTVLAQDDLGGLEVRRKSDGE